MVAQIPPQIEAMENMRTMILTMHSTMTGIFDQMLEMSDNATAMGKALTPPRTTTRSTFHPRFSRTKTSSAP